MTPSQNTILVILAFITACVLSPSAKADFVYLSKEQMITKSDAIAIVVFDKINFIKPTDKMFGPGANYNQEGIATVEQNIKGELPHTLIIYNHFDVHAYCPPTSPLKIGRALVFLTSAHNRFVPINFDLGVRTIVNNKIDWFESNFYHKQATDISQVVNYIKDQLQK